MTRLAPFALLLAACSSAPPRPPAVEVTLAATGTPAPLAPERHARLVAGDGHACFLSAAGALSCWGVGPLGDGTREARPAPVRVPLADVIDVAVGPYETCAVTAGGQVACWGGTGTGVRLSPQVVAGVEGAQAVAVGLHHACARVREGEVVCWGNNEDGQLGDGTKVSRLATPREVSGLSSAVEIAAGGHGTCARVAGGRVLCWGAGSGRQSFVPVAVAGLPAMRSVRMGRGQTCGVSVDRHVFCWGTNFVDTMRPRSPEPVAVDGLAGVREVAVGPSHRCALLEDGSVSCMGAGQPLGRDGWLKVPEVLRAPGDRQPRAAAVAAGGMFTCLLDENGGVSCVGANDVGQLGIGETASFPSPKGEVPGVEDAVAVVPAEMAACALRRDGQVVCWGFGEGFAWTRDLDQGHAVPAAPVPDLPPARALFPGWEKGSLCATSVPGDLYCFRAGASPRPAERRTTDAGRRWLPRRVVGLRDVVDLDPFRSGTVGTAYAVLGSGAVVAFRTRDEQKHETVLAVDTAPLVGLAGVTRFATLDSRACALRGRRGTVACFDLVDPLVERDRPRLVEIAGLRDAIDVTHNGSSWFVRTRGGEVVGITWHLGSYRPTPQPGLRGAVATSHGNTFLAVLPDGTVAAVGDAANDVYGVFPGLDLGPARAVEATHDVRCAVRPTGRVACWGSNLGEALGATERAFSSTLLPVKLPEEPRAAPSP